MIYYKHNDGTRSSFSHFLYLGLAVYFFFTQEWWLLLATLAMALADNFFLVWMQVQEDKR